MAQIDDSFESRTSREVNENGKYSTSDSENDDRISPVSLRKPTRNRNVTNRFGQSEKKSYDDIIELCKNSSENKTDQSESGSDSEKNSDESANESNISYSIRNNKSFLCEGTFKQLIEKFQTDLSNELNKKFDSIEKKIDEIRNQILRLEVKFTSRRDNCLPSGKRSRLMSIDQDRPDNPLDAIKSLGFPLKSVEQVEKFNKDLEGEEFRERAFKAFVGINGDNGIMNARRLIKDLFYNIFTKDTLGNYTFTGKNKNTKKFNVFSNILNFIFELLKAADKSYTLSEFERDTIERVFKYAYRGRIKDSIVCRPEPQSHQLQSLINTENITIEHHPQSSMSLSSSTNQEINPVSLQCQSSAFRPLGSFPSSNVMHFSGNSNSYGYEQSLNNMKESSNSGNMNYVSCGIPPHLYHC